METSERRVEGERVSVNHLKSDTGSDPEDVTTHELSVDAGRTFDRARAEAAVRELLIAVGEDPDREGLRDTPSRVARAYREVFGGLFTDPDEVLDTTFDEGHQELVLVRDIPMYSTCEHHLVSFHGVAHVATSRARRDASPACRSWRVSWTSTPSARRSRNASPARSPTP